MERERGRSMAHKRECHARPHTVYHYERLKAGVKRLKTARKTTTLKRARMDYPQDEEYVVCHDEQRAPEAEDDSLFGMIPSDLLYWMFHRWDPAMRASVVMVCHRWHRVGSAAFNVFRTNKAFLHGLFLDSKHLRSLLSDPRLPRQYLEDPSILSVMFGRVSEYAVLVDLAARAVLTDDMWLTC